MNTKRFLSGILLIALAAGGCSSASARRFPSIMPAPYEEQQEIEKTMVSADSLVQLTANANWYDSSDEAVGESYDLTIGHQKYNPYIGVQSTPKADNPAMSVELFSSIAQEMPQTVLGDDIQVTQTSLTQVKGQPAVQYEAHGTMLDLPVVMLTTAVETADYHHLIVSVFIENEYEQQQEEIHQIIGSFQEVAQAE